MGFLPESCRLADRVRLSRGQTLEGDMTTQFLIPRLINHTHAAFTELLGDLIMPNGFGLTHCRNRSSRLHSWLGLLSFRLDVAQYLRPLCTTVAHVLHVCVRAARTTTE